MRWIRARTSLSSGGRPACFVRDFQRHHRRKPCRCQRITVSGWTSTRTERQRSWPLPAEDGQLLAQGQVLQDELTAWQQEQMQQIANGVKQFHAVARTMRAINRRQQPLRRWNILALSAGRWKEERSPLGLRKKPEGENDGVVGIGPAEAVAGITDSRGLLSGCPEVWAHGKNHNPVNARRERACSISVTSDQRARRESAACFDP
jgi:hypothetical protein